MVPAAEPPDRTPTEDAATPTDGRAVRALRQRARTRARILAAATDIFARVGFGAAAVADILTEAGVSRGTFYTHFESKEAALGAILEGFLDALATTLRPVTTRSPEAARAELIANLERAFALVDDSPALSGLILGRGAALPPEADAYLGRFFDGAAALILRALNAGERLGLVRPGDQALRARLILGALVEAARPGPTPRGPAERRALAFALLDFALAGVLHTPAASTR
jgi:AcrR family transcriptional regulator